MKKIITVLAALILCLSLLAGCGGGGGADSDDPNIGMWKATEGEMFGMTSPVEDFFGSGFTMELKAKGKCSLNVDGSKANGTWSLDGDAFYVKGGGLECNGYLKNGKIVLEDVLGMGLNLVFEKEGGYPGVSGFISDEGMVDSSESDFQQIWNGTWYGKMVIMEGTGKYDTDLGEEAMYLVVDLDANGEGTFTVYSSDYGEWGSGTCEAVEFGLSVLEGELEYSPEPMVPEDWSFFWNSYYDYESHIVNTATFIDYDGDEFEFTLEFRPWGADWEDYAALGRAWTYPPGYDFYMEKLANGEASPWGSFGPGYDGSGGGPAGTGSDIDSDSGASTSSGGGAAAGGGLASAPSFSVDELKAIYDAINADAWDLSQGTAKYEEIRDKYFKGAGADEYIEKEDDSDYRYRWNSVDGSGRVDVYFNKSDDGFKMLGYAW